MVLPYRNPFVVAKAGATLDLLSGGRFTLAVGAGYLKREFAALGVDLDERDELFDEALDVIKAIWTGDDVGFEGRHFSARGVTAHPRPVSDPHPPIWIGGNSGPPVSGSPTTATAGARSRPPPSSPDRPHRRPRHDRRPRRRASTTCGAASKRPAATRRPIDIGFSTPPAASRGRGFNADAHLEGLEELAIPRRHLGAGGAAR